MTEPKPITQYTTDKPAITGQQLEIIEAYLRECFATGYGTVELDVANGRLKFIRKKVSAYVGDCEKQP